MLSQAKKFGIIVVVLILLVTNSGYISSAVTQRFSPHVTTIDIPMCSPNLNQGYNSVKIDGAKYEYANNTGVPDYQSQIYVDTSNPYETQTGQVHIQINDTGIVHLIKPYFYVLVFNPSNNLEYMFPCGYNLTTGTAPYYSPLSQCYTYCNKWTDQLSTGEMINGQGVTCTNSTNVIVPIGNCVSRESLIIGSLAPNEPINYTFSADQSGIWTVYVFLFDDTYVTRPNIAYCQPPSFEPTTSCTPSFESNAVAATVQNFQVSSGIPPTKANSASISLISLAQEGAGVLVAGLSYFVLASEKGYPWVRDKVWYTHKEFIKTTAIFLVIVTIYTILLFYFLPR